jgi:hypothetical protein
MMRGMGRQGRVEVVRGVIWRDIGNLIRHISRVVDIRCLEVGSIYKTVRQKPYFSWIGRQSRAVS